jgi:hypothetical protein
MDPARAQLVVDNLYQVSDGTLRSTNILTKGIKERVGHRLVDSVESLRLWLFSHGRDQLPVDTFLFRLFEELLATDNFQPEPDLEAAAVCDWLVRSAGRFRLAADKMGFNSTEQQGVAFIDWVYNGMVATYPPQTGDSPDLSGIVISTIYSFLLSGRSVKYQVWLDCATTGWWDIPRQPLSNAFILAREWDSTQAWTMTHEFEVRNQLLGRIVQGLTNRCREGIILASSNIDRRGLHQEGPLWRALYSVRKGKHKS